MQTNDEGTTSNTFSDRRTTATDDTDYIIYDMYDAIDKYYDEEIPDKECLAEHVRAGLGIRINKAPMNLNGFHSVRNNKQFRKQFAHRVHRMVGRRRS